MALCASCTFSNIAKDFPSMMSSSHACMQNAWNTSWLWMPSIQAESGVALGWRSAHVVVVVVCVVVVIVVVVAVFLAAVAFVRGLLTRASYWS